MCTWRPKWTFFWVKRFCPKKNGHTGFFVFFFNIWSKKYGFCTAKYGQWSKKYSHTAKYGQIRAFDQKKWPFGVPGRHYLQYSLLHLLIYCICLFTCIFLFFFPFICVFMNCFASTIGVYLSILLPYPLLPVSKWRLLLSQSSFGPFKGSGLKALTLPPPKKTLQVWRLFIHAVWVWCFILPTGFWGYLAPLPMGL